MKSYSNDLRQKIVLARSNGTSAAELARLLSISKRSVQRYWKQYLESASIAPKQRGGYRRSRLAGHEHCLRQWLENDNSLTLKELSKRLEEELNIQLGTTALWHQLNQLGLSYKKNAAWRRARLSRYSGCP